jgi:hypothetical protein
MASSVSFRKNLVEYDGMTEKILLNSCLVLLFRAEFFVTVYRNMEGVSQKFKNDFKIHPFSHSAKANSLKLWQIIMHTYY